MSSSPISVDRKYMRHQDVREYGHGSGGCRYSVGTLSDNGSPAPQKFERSPSRIGVALVVEQGEQGGCRTPVVFQHRVPLAPA